MYELDGCGFVFRTGWGGDVGDGVGIVLTDESRVVFGGVALR